MLALDDGAENKKSENIVFDYCDFFSVLMYYAHMNKDDIMCHSRAFLHGIYRMYVKRACENLGVSSKSEKDNTEIEEDNTLNQYELSKEDYPDSFIKMPPRNRTPAESSPEKTRNFLASFGAGAEVFKDVHIIEDS